MGVRMEATGELVLFFPFGRVETVGISRIDHQGLVSLVTKKKEFQVALVNGQLAPLVNNMLKGFLLGRKLVETVLSFLWKLKCSIDD